MNSPAEATLRFTDFTLDIERGALLDGGVEVRLRPKSFEVLRYLASNAGRLATKDELVQAVWGKASVSDESVARCISDIRAALRDEAGEIVTTVPRRGYRFSAQVDTNTKGEIADGILKSPRLSIVVMPFLNLGGGADQDPFVDGVTDSLTTDLSRIRDSLVIARNTAFTYKGKPADVRQIGRELNVRYILEGSVLRDTNRVRINVQLIEAETGHHIWADRFDKPIADLLDMQDEIVGRLAGSLNAQFVAAEARRAQKASNPNATDLYYQGAFWLNQGANIENMERALEFFERALTIEPGNVRALVGSATADIFFGSQIMVDNPATALAAAETKLTRALSLAPDDAGGHLALGIAYMCTKRVVQGIAECQYAVMLDRNNAHAHATIGFGKIYVDRPEETEAHILDALRLSPRDPFAALWMTNAGTAKSRMGQITEAAEWYRRAIEANRGYAYPHFVWGAMLVRLGRLDEARASIKSGLALNPKFSLSRARVFYGGLSNDAEFLARFETTLEAWRLAGVPE